MFRTLEIIKRHGFRTIRDVKNVNIDTKFRGLPKITAFKCSAKCNLCNDVCPTFALSFNPLSINLASCIFCGECENNCERGAITFTNFYKLSSTNIDSLLITDKITKDNFEEIAFKTRNKIVSKFKRSFKIRQVSAGGCNGCEQEIYASQNVNFNFQRFGIDIVASPRHADAIMITGPITKNMSRALEDAYNSIPKPKIIILVGTCSISGGIFAKSEAIDRKFLEDKEIDLYIPGCPPHPLTIVNGLLSLLDK